MTAPVRPRRTAPAGSALRWSDALGRYQDARGRIVSASAVRADLDRALEDSGRTMARLTDQLRERRISLIDWEIAMRREVKAVQLYSVATAKGGLAQMSPADYGRVGASTREQYRYLARFAQQIEDGLPLDGRATQRVQMYAQAGRAAYHKTERGEMARRGFTHESNVLAPADHCDLCLAQSKRGRVPIGALVPIGQRTCLSRCKCQIAYHTAAS